MKCSKCCGDGRDVVEGECKEKLGAASNMICSFHSSVNRCVITTTASPQDNTTNNHTSTYITRTSPSRIIHQAGNSTVTSSGRSSTPYMSKTKTFRHWVAVAVSVSLVILIGLLVFAAIQYCCFSSQRRGSCLLCISSGGADSEMGIQYHVNEPEFSTVESSGGIDNFIMCVCFGF